MANLTFDTSWNAFQPGKYALLYSAEEFKEEWLIGIPLCNIKLSDNVIQQKLIEAQDYVESFLSLKLFRQIMFEDQDFQLEQYISWGFIMTNWQINAPISLVGRYNEQTVMNYPFEWLSIKRGNDQLDFNNLYIVPNGQSSSAVDFLYASFSQVMFNGIKRIPNFWHVKYVTGFDDIPPEIMRLIGLLASIDILPMIELSLLGGQFGLASSSLSIDGMSQSTSKMNGGNIFQNRIKQYREDVTDIKQTLRNIYGGLKFNVC